jgi:hypothetical protein
LQNAQIEVIKLRSTSELAVRRILTAQQLAKFRELRQKFMENTERRPNSHPRPLRIFRIAVLVIGNFRHLRQKLVYKN